MIDYITGTAARGGETVHAVVPGESKALCGPAVTTTRDVWDSVSAYACKRCLKKAVLPKYGTREEWLMAFLAEVAPWMNEGAKQALGTSRSKAARTIWKLDQRRVRLSCGFPSSRALGARSRAIGECWDMVVSSAGRWELFISPLLDDALEVAATAVHELAHAGLGTKAGHGPRFAKVAKALLLEGKPTATYASDAFKRQMEQVLAKLGEYPHAKLVPNHVRKRQSTRLLKVACSGCGYPARVTRKWLDTVGAPLCPSGHGVMILNDGGDDGDD